MMNFISGSLDINYDLSFQQLQILALQYCMAIFTAILWNWMSQRKFGW